MDLASEVRKFGNVWTLEVNSHLQNILEPLHATNFLKYKDKVKEEKNVKYGCDERHRLDIYSPAAAYMKSCLPTIVYFHGGGFAAGDNQITASMHGNIGNYFASEGYVCVLATYRILPVAVYPNGAADVASTIAWLIENIEKYGGHKSMIFPMGQSAGGAHLATALFTGLLRDQIKHCGGFIFQSVPFWYNMALDRRRQNMFLYHQTNVVEDVKLKMSVSVFAQCKPEDVQSWPAMLTMVGEYDSEEIVNGTLQFVDLYRKKTQRLPLLEVLEGHNHISYALGIGLAGDHVGPRIIAFMSNR